MERIRTTLLWIAAALDVGGMGIAAWLLHAKVRIRYDATFESACNFGGKLNCDAVQTSPWSEVLGVPVALLAIPTYALMALLAVAGARAARAGDRGKADGAIALLFAAGLATTGYAVWLGYLSAFVIHAFCVFCITMYAIQLATALLAWGAARRGVRDLVVDAFRAAGRFASPLPVGAIAFAAVLAAGTVAYRLDTRAMLARSLGAEAAPPAAQAPAAPASPAAPAPSPAARAPSAPAPAAAVDFDVPVGPDDYVFGPKDAAVTLVDFADFQCSYCRVLATELRRLKPTYADRVRFVFKHYPMNGDCNPAMPGERMHENACAAARAAHCASVQGRFWEMHDRLYDNQERLDAATMEGHAKALGLDVEKWKACLADPATDARIVRDAALGAKARINATPSVFINGRLVRGLSAEIIEYHLKHALAGSMGRAAAAEAVLPDAKTPPMVQAKTARGTFWIDAFEASVDGDGRALSLPGATPARLSWFDAKEACAKAGKRLCTEEEWVSACAGVPAVDNNGNGLFADDAVEGRMFPYGLFYEKGRCRDAEDRYQGGPGDTGVRAGCRTPDGVYDLAGNLGEWTGAEPAKAALLGGDWRAGEGAACNRRSATFGPGIKNATTGFRCCADAPPAAPARAVADVDTSSTKDLVGRPVPAFELPALDGGAPVASGEFRRNKVTYLTFFASWCGPCKRELPELNRFLEKYGPQGFRVAGVGCDRQPETSRTFAAQYQPRFPLAHDADSVVMGRFDVDAMPASFLVDRKGVVRYRHVGFKPEEIPEIEAQIQSLLAE